MSNASYSPNSKRRKFVDDSRHNNNNSINNNKTTKLHLPENNKPTNQQTNIKEEIPKRETANAGLKPDNNIPQQLEADNDNKPSKQQQSPMKFCYNCGAKLFNIESS